MCRREGKAWSPFPIRFDKLFQLTNATCEVKLRKHFNTVGGGSVTYGWLPNSAFKAWENFRWEAVK